MNNYQQKIDTHREFSEQNEKDLLLCWISKGRADNRVNLEDFLTPLHQCLARAIIAASPALGIPPDFTTIRMKLSKDSEALRLTGGLGELEASLMEVSDLHRATIVCTFEQRELLTRCVMEASMNREKRDLISRMDKVHAAGESTRFISHRIKELDEQLDALTNELVLIITEDEPLELPSKLPDVLPFAPEMLPEVFRDYVMDGAIRMGCSPDFIAVSLMTSFGSLLGRKVAIAPKSKDTWHEFPNVWGMVVGRPSAMKSPAMEAGTSFLKRLAADAMNRFQDEREAYAINAKIAAMKLKAAEKEAQRVINEGGAVDARALEQKLEPAPTQKRYDTQSANFASLHMLLSENPQGLLLYNDELAGLLSSFDGDDGQQFKALLLQLWAGKTGFTADRIGRGLNLHLPATTISILGSTQPGKIAYLVKDAINEGPTDDGFLQRFPLLVWPDVPRINSIVDSSPNAEAKRRVWELFENFEKWTPQIDCELINKHEDSSPAILRFDDDAYFSFMEWLLELETLTRSGALTPALESHFSKYKKAIPALALIYALATDPEATCVNKQALDSALLWDDYLRSHAQRFYGAGAYAVSDAARAILMKFEKGTLSPSEAYTAREIYRKGWSGLTDVEVVSDALDLLKEYRWMSCDKIQRESGGRPLEEYKLTGIALTKLTKP